MRLTLRTLLAYLDDTLEPAQAREIGRKIAESEQARELIERINQIMRRRRITMPPAEGPGAMFDANTLGEYLDNLTSPEQAAEIEELCLTSDNHLAEVAACHQILSLVVSEPALVPPSAKRRMYRLVKGPEAIPFRKPPPSLLTQETDQPSDGRDDDDTLRLGVPAVGSRQRVHPLALIAAGTVVVGLLLVAVWQLLRHRSVPAGASGDPAPIVHVDPEKKPPVVPEEEPAVKPKPIVEPQPPPPKVSQPELKLDVPWSPPSIEMKRVGRIVEAVQEPAIVVTYAPEMMEWRRLQPKNPEVWSGQLLVSLPAARSVIDLGHGLSLTLVGNSPELYLPPPRFYEAAVELHWPEPFDVDLTLRRGRLRLRTESKPARVRLRFANPTRPQQHEAFDFLLERPGTEILVELFFTWVDNEKFYRDRQAADRIGPLANVSCFVIEGIALLKHHDVTRPLTAPPGTCQAFWLSLSGLDPPHHFEKLPEGLLTPLQPMGWDGTARLELLRARDALSQRLLAKPVDVALAESLKAPDAALRRLACRCLAAVDDVSTLLELLEQEGDAELRTLAEEMLRYWISAGRDHDYQVYDLLKAKYRAPDPDTIMNLLHGFGEKAAKDPATSEMLLGYLNHPQLAIRELAALRLEAIAPGRQRARYNPTDPAAARLQAQATWRALIGLPPSPTKKK
ncbi:MAG: hypothetical protein NZO58_08495 [Gemmataceae bacterium]|nr:hypothetical protein [Gemmataceae bacterium]